MGTAGGQVHVRCVFKNDITGGRGREREREEIRVFDKLKAFC